jgi:hypothetical protein
MTTRQSRSMWTRLARPVLLGFWLIVVTVALVELIGVQLALTKVAPWSYLGLVGLAAVAIALGSPRRSRIGDD